MQQLLQSYMKKEEWMVELGFDAYSSEQQEALWELVVRAAQTKVLDTLLDQLSMEDQRRLIQHLSEDDLSEQLSPFLESKVPNYSKLLSTTLIEYRKVLKRDLSRLVSRPEEG